MMLHIQRDADMCVYIYIFFHYNVDPYIPSFNFLFLLTFYYEVLRNSIVIVMDGAMVGLGGAMTPPNFF